MDERSVGGDEHVVVRVSLVGSDPVLWRQLSVAGALPLNRVHEILQAVLGWEDAHLHRFTAKDPFARITKEELEQGWPLQWLPAGYVQDEEDRSEEEMTLARLLQAGTGSAFYEYDFGDSWLHLIEAVGSQPAGPALVRLTGGEGACPPEDCGGVFGYRDLLDASAGPEDTGTVFDPYFFDSAAATAELSTVLQRWQTTAPSGQPGTPAGM